MAANVAVTDWFADSVRSQSAVPAHAPAQPLNRFPASATAVRWSFDPLSIVTRHCPRQSEPAPRTVPFPVVRMSSVACDGGPASGPVFPGPPLWSMLVQERAIALASNRVADGRRMCAPGQREPARSPERWDLLRARQEARERPELGSRHGGGRRGVEAQ